MNFSEFLTVVNAIKLEIFKETFFANRDTIKVKKEKTAIKNLDKIFNATINISNNKGFQAMTMRDLSQATGLSMGALYAYFPSKEKLLELLQLQGVTVVRRIMDENIEKEKTPEKKLRAAIKTHLYLSQAMQPWYFFTFMEAKHLSQNDKKIAVLSELDSERIFSDILKKGQDEGAFLRHDPQLGASVIKAMLQDWYLKRWKYTRRAISVDKYANFIIGMVESHYLLSRNRKQKFLTRRLRIKKESLN